jgi:Peptidase family M48
MRLTMLVTVTMLGGVGSVSQMLFGTLTRGMAIVLSREREFLADAAAVEFTRNPTGLISALRKIAETGTPLKRASLATAPLFFVDPFKSAGCSYAGLICELTRIHSQTGKSDDERGGGRRGSNEIRERAISARHEPATAGIDSSTTGPTDRAPAATRRHGFFRGSIARVPA